MAAAAGAADLLGLGSHCSVSHCGQIDFLPFQCDCCKRVFCLEHRAYSAHECKEAGTRQTEVVPCPLCARGIRLQGRDANVAWEEHQREGTCDASNWRKVHAKPRCPVKGCKERLTTVNTYACKRCSQRVCLKHRHEDDHGCSEALAAAAAARKASTSGAAAAAGSFFSQLTSALTPSRPTSAPPPASAASRQLPQPTASSSGAYENSVRGTAERRRQQQHSGSGAAAPQQQVEALNPMHQQQQQRYHQPSQAPPASASSLPEACPQCGARFASVERLVQHVEDFHPSDAPTSTTTNARQQAPPAAQATAPRPPPPQPAAAAAAGNYGRRLGSAADASSPYRCPHCERGFDDPALLVHHAEACPAAPSRGTSGVAAGGAGKADCNLM